MPDDSHDWGPQLRKRELFLQSILTAFAFAPFAAIPWMALSSCSEELRPVALVISVISATAYVASVLPKSSYTLVRFLMRRFRGR